MSKKKKGFFGKKVSRKPVEVSIPRERHFGVLKVHPSGSSFVSDSLDTEVFVHSSKMRSALNKDEVEAELYYNKTQKKLEARVLSVTKRYKTVFSGGVRLEGDTAFVSSINKAQQNIWVDPKDLNGAQHGDKVAVEITDWGEKTGTMRGVVQDILGKRGNHKAEISSILIDDGLPYKFPTEVELFVKQLDLRITPEEISKRRDVRHINTFTIDPKDAKDFDDAISFQTLPNGNYEVGVHIADVSHYVKPDTILDKEAYARATSIYLVDRVVPMLPEILSNGVCSLRPNEEKYTFSAIFEVDSQAQVLNRWFGKTVICSNLRLSYEEAQWIVENGNVEIPTEVALDSHPHKPNADIVEAILKLNDLSKIMRKRRMGEGAIDFDKVEVKFILDDKDNPVDVYFKEAKDANKLIEEFMLLANKHVAEFVGKELKLPFVYRTHDEPNPDKLMALKTVAAHFGHKLDVSSGGKQVSKSLNTLIKTIKGKKEQTLLDILALRTMSKAKYTTNNIGHYGLAFPYYTHFTSPIRRYPDVMVHRLLEHYLHHNEPANTSKYEAFCRHCSAMEDVAVSAERHSVKYMQLRFMENHINQKFLAVISGVTERGIFVEIIENRCEGFIRIGDLSDDYYHFNAEKFYLEGRRTKKTYQLGDEIKVLVKSIDLEKRHLNFVIV